MRVKDKTLIVFQQTIELDNCVRKIVCQMKVKVETCSPSMVSLNRNANPQSYKLTCWRSNIKHFVHQYTVSVNLYIKKSYDGDYCTYLKTFNGHCYFISSTKSLSQ